MAAKIIVGASRPARVLPVLCVALTVLLSSSPARAQAATGDILGTVVEQAAGPLAGASVVVANRDTGGQRRVTSDANGLFTVAGLPAGSYRVTATLAGFAEVRDDAVDVHVGQSVVSRLVMRRAPLAETISLTPPTVAIAPLQATIGTPITAGEIVTLPLPTRDPLDLVSLTPFLPADRDGHGWATFALPGTLTALAVDGTDDQNTYFASAFGRHNRARGAYQFPQPALQEIKVDVGAPRAEFGHGATAFVTAVTKSGANRFAGELSGRYRDGQLSAATPLERRQGLERSPQHANQFGGAVGGPLVADRSFFFAAYDGLRAREDNAVAFPVDPPLSPGASLLSTSAGPWRRTRDQDVAFVRTDHVIGRSARLAVRYNHQNLRGAGLEQDGDLIAADASAASLVQTRSLAVTLGAAPHRRLMNEARLLYARDRDLGSPRSDAAQADVRDSGALLLRVGGDAANPHDTRLERWQLADTVMVTAGRHLLKAGVDLEVNDVRDRSGANVAGLYRFQSLSGFASGVPSAPGETYSQAFLPPGSASWLVRPDSRSYAAFVQDTWRIAPALTLDAGVRYDLQTFRDDASPATDAALVGSAVTTRMPAADTNNLGPRLGIAWTPSRRYVARVAYGIGYAPTPLSFAAAVQRYGGGDVRLVTLAGAGGDAVPTYPSVLSAPPPTTSGLPLVVAFARDFEQPRVQHVTTGLEFQWMPQTSIGLGYVHATGRDLPQATERNVGAAVPTTFIDAGSGVSYVFAHYTPGSFAAISRLLTLDSTGVSTYDGVAIELRRDLLQGIHYRLAYTLAKATDTGILTTVMPETSADRLANTADAPQHMARAAADNDQRHRVVLDFVYLTDAFAARQRGKMRTLLDRWRVAAALSLESGRPYTAYVASDLNGDGNQFNDIAPGTTRNQFRRDKRGLLNARLARDLRLGGLSLIVSLDLFNALNAVHNRDVDDILYSAAGGALFRNPQFGQTSTTSDPRVLQLGLTVRF